MVFKGDTCDTCASGSLPPSVSSKSSGRNIISNGDDDTPTTTNSIIAWRDNSTDGDMGTQGEIQGPTNDSSTSSLQPYARYRLLRLPARPLLLFLCTLILTTLNVTLLSIGNPYKKYVQGITHAMTHTITRTPLTQADLLTLGQRWMRYEQQANAPLRYAPSPKPLLSLLASIRLSLYATRHMSSPEPPSPLLRLDPQGSLVHLPSSGLLVRPHDVRLHNSTHCSLPPPSHSIKRVISLGLTSGH